MSLDERIKNELESESSRIDEILNDKQGLFDLVVGSYKTGLGRWVVAVNVCILIVTAGFIWAGYQFYLAPGAESRIFWGVCLIILINIQVALKQWVWLEMNRGSLLREIKRVEIEVARLAQKLS